MDYPTDKPEAEGLNSLPENESVNGFMILNTETKDPSKGVGFSDVGNPDLNRRFVFFSQKNVDDFYNNAKELKTVPMLPTGVSLRVLNEDEPEAPIEGYMVIGKDTKDPSTAVGFTTTGAPRFLFFSKGGVQKFFLAAPELSKKTHYTKRLQYEIVRVAVEVL